MRFYEFNKPVFEDYVAITHANVTMWRHVNPIKWRSKENNNNKHNSASKNKKNSRVKKASRLK